MFMRYLAIAAVAATMATPAAAIERYTSTGMSCAEVHDRIAAGGAVIMQHMSTRVAGMRLYGRYVSNGRFCDAGEAAQTVYIPAGDTDSCQVKECKRVEFDDNILLMPN